MYSGTLHYRLVIAAKLVQFGSHIRHTQIQGENYTLYNIGLYMSTIHTCTTQYQKRKEGGRIRNTGCNKGDNLIMNWTAVLVETPVQPDLPLVAGLGLCQEGRGQTSSLS